MKKHYIIPIFVPHLGCPHDCVFCNQTNITGEDRREADRVNYDFVIKTAEEHLKTIDRDNSEIELSFFGGTFTAIEREKQEDLLKAAFLLKEKGLIDHIRCSTRPDYIDFNILMLLKKYGMDIIELGVQSLDPEVLIKSGRGHDDYSVESASRQILDLGITLGHQIMPGLPGDNFEKVIETARRSISMKPSQVRIYPTLVIRDTAMEEMYHRGEYQPFSIDEAVEITSIVKKMYEDAEVKVIRCGLQMSENLTYEKDLVAGPFHSAFGELVESFDLNRKLFSKIKEMIETSSITKDKEKIDIGEVDLSAEIEISSRRISKLYSDSKRYFKENLEKLKEDFNISNIKVKSLKDDSLDIKITIYDENNKVTLQGNICI